MAEPPDLSDLVTTHKLLLEELNSKRRLLFSDLTERATFVGKVEALIKQLGEKAPLATDTDFLWLSEAVNTWRLQCARNLDYILYVPILRRSAQATGNKLTAERIDNFAKQKADQISLIRRQLKAQRAAERIYSEYSDEERDWDYYHATHYVGLDILYGRGDVWPTLDQDFDKDAKIVWPYFTDETFIWAEKVWLRDVLELRAYELGEQELGENKRKFPSSPEQAAKDMLDALGEFRKKLVDDAEKKSVSNESRKALVDFLKKRYLVPEAAALDMNKQEVKALIRAKKDRIKGLRQEAGDVDADTPSQKVYSSIL